MLDKIRESSKYLAPFVKGEHTIGIILGTGLGELGKSIEIEHAIPYMAIPNFPVSTVQGHRENCLSGPLGVKSHCHAGTFPLLRGLFHERSNLSSESDARSRGKDSFRFQRGRRREHELSGWRPDDHPGSYQPIPGTPATR